MIHETAEPLSKREETSTTVEAEPQGVLGPEAQNLINHLLSTLKDFLKEMETVMAGERYQKEIESFEAIADTFLLPIKMACLLGTISENDAEVIRWQLQKQAEVLVLARLLRAKDEKERAIVVNHLIGGDLRHILFSPGASERMRTIYLRAKQAGLLPLRYDLNKGYGLDHQALTQETSEQDEPLPPLQTDEGEV